MDFELDLNKLANQVGLMVIWKEITNSNIPKKDKDYIIKLIKIFVSHGVDIATAFEIINDISNLN